MTRDEQRAFLAILLRQVSSSPDALVRRIEKDLADTGHALLVVSQHDSRDALEQAWAEVEFLGTEDAP